MTAPIACRTVRVLRPLRAMTRVKGMKLLVDKIIATVPALGDVTLLLSFEYIIFGIIGVQLFQGALAHGCAVLMNPRPECVGCDFPYANYADGNLQPMNMLFNASTGLYAVPGAGFGPPILQAALSGADVYYDPSTHPVTRVTGLQAMMASYQWTQPTAYCAPNCTIPDRPIWRLLQNGNSAGAAWLCSQAQQFRCSPPLPRM